jgi:hypothetical protein
LESQGICDRKAIFPDSMDNREAFGGDQHSDGYTTDWLEPEDSDSIPSYFVDQFGQRSEEDFGFQEAVKEYPHEEPRTPIPEDRSLGNRVFLSRLSGFINS